MCHCRVEIVNFLVHLLVQILNHMWVTSSKLHNLAIRVSNKQNTYYICIYLTIIPRVHVGYEMVESSHIQQAWVEQLFY